MSTYQQQPSENYVEGYDWALFVNKIFSKTEVKKREIAKTDWKEAYTFTDKFSPVPPTWLEIQHAITGLWSGAVSWTLGNFEESAESEDFIEAGLGAALDSKFEATTGWEYGDEFTDLGSHVFSVSYSDAYLFPELTTGFSGIPDPESGTLAITDLNWQSYHPPWLHLNPQDAYFSPSGFEPLSVFGEVAAGYQSCHAWQYHPEDVDITEVPTNPLNRDVHIADQTTPSPQSDGGDDHY